MKKLNQLKHQALTEFMDNLLPGSRIEQMPIPDCADLSLFLLNEDYPQHELDAATMMRLMDEPAYWCFCWASGQVLAQYIFANPELVANKTVMDFGAGSGVVAVAAAMAGAKRVVVCDNDPLALQACQANAELNNVSIELLDDLFANTQQFDIAIVADVLYDRDNLPLLHELKKHADDILVADSRIKDFNEPGFSKLSLHHSCTLPDLNESEEFNWVTLYRSNPS